VYCENHIEKKKGRVLVFNTAVCRVTTGRYAELPLGRMQSYHWALTVNIMCMHKMIVVLGSADCVLRRSRLLCGLLSDQRGQMCKRADIATTGTTVRNFRCK
jgi:hypothetical protein